MDVLLDALLRSAPEAFGFLVAEHGFSAPQRIADGLRYERGDLRVEVRVLTWHKETEFSTTVSWPRADGGRTSRRLERLLGERAHAVGSFATSGHTVRKRVAEHAAALATVIATARGRSL